MLINVLRDEQPTHVGVAFDKSRQTFRLAEYAEYKAKRNKTPEEFSSQLPLINEVLDALRIRHLAKEGYEADDIIATLVTEALAEGMEVLILTGDRDSLQLVTEHSTVLYPMRGVSELARMTPEAVQAKYGVPPRPLPRAGRDRRRDLRQPARRPRRRSRVRRPLDQRVRRPRQRHHPCRQDHRQEGRGPPRAPRRRDPQPPAQRPGPRPRPRARPGRPRGPVVGPRPRAHAVRLAGVPGPPRPSARVVGRAGRHAHRRLRVPARRARASAPARSPAGSTPMPVPSPARASPSTAAWGAGTGEVRGARSRGGRRPGGLDRRRRGHARRRRGA